MSEDSTVKLDNTVLTHTIYEILCLENGKRYIGCTSNIGKRREQHLAGIHNNNHPNPLLLEDSKKYDVTKFSFTTIEKCAEGESIGREKYWILRFRSHLAQFGYNVTVDACDVKLHAGELSPPKKVKASIKRNSKKVVREKKKEVIQPLDESTKALIRIADACYGSYVTHLNAGGTKSFLEYYDHYRGYTPRIIALESSESVHDTVPRESDLFEYR